MRSMNLSFAAASLIALGGCAATASPQWDARFGDSARGLTAQQLIEPGAPARNAQTVAKSDGRSTRDAMDEASPTRGAVSARAPSRATRSREEGLKRGTVTRRA